MERWGFVYNIMSSRYDVVVVCEGTVRFQSIHLALYLPESGDGKYYFVKESSCSILSYLQLSF